MPTPPIDTTWPAIIWQQFGAPIDMLDNGLLACPEMLWHDRLWSERFERPAFSEF
jgi:hypothetical protein